VRAILAIQTSFVRLSYAEISISKINIEGRVLVFFFLLIKAHLIDSLLLHAGGRDIYATIVQESQKCRRSKAS
jgi:hypothetical protein